MNARVLRTLVLAAAFAASIVAGSPAAAQSCGCLHQGGSVDCPDNLPAGSRSTQFVTGGTMWVTPTGQSVFVPHTSFTCTSSAMTTPSVQQSKTPSVQAPSAPQTGSGKGSRDQSNDLFQHFIREHLSHDDKSHRNTSYPVMRDGCKGYSCAGRLEEDPAMVCYSNVRSTVMDGNSVSHGDSLYVQLGLAAGIAHAQIGPVGSCTTCNEPAYDCGGTFYDGSGSPIRVPALPASIRSDADVKNWKVDMQLFYHDAHVDPHGTRLSPGKAALCTKWAGVSFQSSPDPSLLQALNTLQQIGAEQAVAQDRQWMTNIISAGEAHGCPTPPVSTQHDEESWFVPESSARSFSRDFRNCERPDTSGVGGCPHAFDTRSGNQVNADFLLDGNTMRGGSAALFVADEAPPCGAECYRRTDMPRGEAGQRSPAASNRFVSTAASRDADADCTAAINMCLQACVSSNAALTRQCIASGGAPSGGTCATNVEQCSCIQTVPVCKTVPVPSGTDGK